MHTVPLAAWAALVGLIGAPVALDSGEAPCEPPSCVPATHGFLMRPPLVFIGSGDSVEWRAGNGHHWFVESGTTGGCLGFALEPDESQYRVRFILASDSLRAVHPLPGGGFELVECAGALILPNGMAAMRYACALHSREGGMGLLLVNPSSGDGPGWDFLA